ncbi:MAG: OmpA family protein [Agriterribacter sp.]
MFTWLFAILFFTAIPKSKAQIYDTLYVHFEFNKSVLTPKAKQSIDSLFSKVMQIGYLKNIGVTGHCDSIGNDEYNDSLSLTRVAAIKDYMFEKGASERLFNEQRGFGKRKPITENNTDQNRLLNRRAEIIIKSIPKPGVVINQPPPKQAAPPVAKVPTPKPPPPPKQFATIYDFVKDVDTKTGDSLVLKNLNFIGGRHYPIQSSFTTLEELLQVMRDIPSLNIEIQGHICCEINGSDGVDTDTNTRDLSIQRAKFVFDYLKGNGVGPDRMRYKGFGSTRKLFVDEKNEDQQLANRRVEIKIISK